MTLEKMTLTEFMCVDFNALSKAEQQQYFDLMERWLQKNSAEIPPEQIVELRENTERIQENLIAELRQLRDEYRDHLSEIKAIKAA